MNGFDTPDRSDDRADRPDPPADLKSTIDAWNVHGETYGSFADDYAPL
jgi:hypothetical protein